MELDYKYFMNRLIVLEKDIKDYRSECATMSPIMWQYRYLSSRKDALKHAIRAFYEMQFRFEMLRSPEVQKRVYNVIHFRPSMEFTHAVNRYRDLQDQLFDRVEDSDLPF